MRHVPEIKLIRTDTTLDLSQKAEKVCASNSGRGTKTFFTGPPLTGAKKKKKILQKNKF
jgi:hypothetical protein